MPAVRADLNALPPLSGRLTLAEQLRLALEQAIVTGALDPGVRLRLDDIAQRYGVSRIPVREALQVLHADGWIELRPRQGTYVRSLRADEPAELKELLMPLEQTAFRAAALRRTEQQARTLVGLAISLPTGHADYGPCDAATVSATGRQVVATAIEASHNPTLIRIVRLLQRRLRWYETWTTTIDGPIPTERYRALATAIERRDPAAAERCAVPGPRAARPRVLTA